MARVICKSLLAAPKWGLISIRHGHHLRGKPPGIARTIQQRLRELRYQDPELHFKVDIGLPPPMISRSEQLQARLKVLKQHRHDLEIEKLARHQKLLIDLDRCNKEWVKSGGPGHIRTIADHYGVFEHLFGDAYFNPMVPIFVSFNTVTTESDKVVEVDYPVYFGNVIKPRHAADKPKVEFQSSNSSLWTLILTNPDGHFSEQDREYVHWFVGNISGNNIAKGETIVDYLQPFPPKGTGYHRHIFVLYKQDDKIDFSDYKLSPQQKYNLSDRTFSTLQFYTKLQDKLTPGGLAFFQSNWDSSLPQFFRNTLDMKEPIFEYDFPAPYIRPAEWFPIRKPFNLYLDKYRDPKQINKEFLMRKLRDVHPFKKALPRLPYPNAQYFEGYVPSWLKLEIRKSRLKWGRINDIE